MRELRDLTRYRKSLMDERVRLFNRLHKLLESANIKLASVASDIMGASGRAMMEALLGGNTDPDVLAELSRGRLRNKLPELKKALEGRFSGHHRFMLEQILNHVDFLDECIERVSQEVARRSDAFEEQIQLLCSIPGLERRAAEAIVAEIGLNMERSPTHHHLASWATMCPGNEESAGNRKSGRTRKGNRWLKRILLEVSWAASRSKGTYLKALYHRLAARRGKKRAVVAVGHTILVIIYHLLRDNVPYEELGADYFDKLNVAYIKRHHVRRLKSLGFTVSIEPIEKAA